MSRQAGPRPLVRREVLVGTGAAVAASAGATWYERIGERLHRAATMIARAETYDGARLEDVVRRGLATLGFGPGRVRGRSVLLKPNLVDPSRARAQINTHPAVVRAAAEVFRRWDAREVIVAEGTAHVRDTLWVLEESGLGAALAEDRLPFVDLNYDDVFTAPNAFGASVLRELHLPRALRRADLVVSLPKLKTHHWTGVTLSMKNLFGVMPGVRYGWPKNGLHRAGIDQCVIDIAATVGAHLAIVDGIVGMEGDGPIVGDARPAHVLVMGTNLPAVDATATRVMGFDPRRIDHLRAASGWLGPIAERHIEQRGEPLRSVVQRFALPAHPHFDRFRG